MSFPTLAEHVVEVLAQSIVRQTDRPGPRPADTLYDAVVGRLRRTGTTGTLELFVADPTAPVRRRPLIDTLNRQFRDDPRFREMITSLVEATDVAPPQPPRPPADRSRFAMIAAAVLTGGLLVAGFVVYRAVTAEAPPDGNTTCGDFIVMTVQDQRPLVERLYRDRARPMDGDPYIVASVLYECGQTPDHTLNQILDRS